MGRPSRKDKVVVPDYSEGLQLKIDDDDPRFNSALARGLAILRSFHIDQRFLANSDIAERTGIPKPTVSRLTYTLTQLGYLRYREDLGKYEVAAGVVGERAAGGEDQRVQRGDAGGDDEDADHWDHSIPRGRAGKPASSGPRPGPGGSGRQVGAAQRAGGLAGPALVFQWSGPPRSSVSDRSVTVVYGAATKDAAALRLRPSWLKSNWQWLLGALLALAAVAGLLLWRAGDATLATVGQTFEGGSYDFKVGDHVLAGIYGGSTGSIMSGPNGYIGNPFLVVGDAVTATCQLSADTGPALKYGGAEFAAGQFGGWTPISAEAIRRAGWPFRERPVRTATLPRANMTRILCRCPAIRSRMRSRRCWAVASTARSSRSKTRCMAA